MVGFSRRAAALAAALEALVAGPGAVQADTDAPAPYPEVARLPRSRRMTRSGLRSPARR